MTNTPDSGKLLHDLRSKCSSLKSAAELYKDCSPAEKKEMLALILWVKKKGGALKSSW